MGMFGLVRICSVVRNDPRRMEDPIRLEICRSQASVPCFARFPRPCPSWLRQCFSSVLTLKSCEGLTWYRAYFGTVLSIGFVSYNHSYQNLESKNNERPGQLEYVIITENQQSKSHLIWPNEHDDMESVKERKLNSKKKEKGASNNVACFV